MDKILLIDKPKDWTSFDVVAKIRGELKRITGQKIKVGHAGTLDPFATGLLIILIGQATKKQDEFMKKDKEYEATLKLGFTSTTGDPEGEITPCPSIVIPAEAGIQKNPGSQIKFGMTEEEIEEVLKKFKGEITQTPHIYSAVKIDGKRAYEIARKGEIPEIKSRKITIHKIELIDLKYPELKIRVKCSSGTYIRVLAEDIGTELGCGAYLTELRRTKIGEFDIKNALTIEKTLKVLTSLEQ